MYPLHLNNETSLEFFFFEVSALSSTAGKNAQASQTKELNWEKIKWRQEHFRGTLSPPLDPYVQFLADILFRESVRLSNIVCHFLLGNNFWDFLSTFQVHHASLEKKLYSKMKEFAPLTIQDAKIFLTVFSLRVYPFSLKKSCLEPRIQTSFQNWSDNTGIVIGIFFELQTSVFR